MTKYEDLAAFEAQEDQLGRPLECVNTTPTQPMDHPLGLSLNTWVSQHRATGHDVRYTMLSARCEDCGDWGPSKWAVDDDEDGDPQDTTTRGRHREATTRPTWLLPALGALAAVVLLIVLAACSGETVTSAEREADRLEAGLPAKPPSEPAVEEPNDWSDAEIFELAMDLQLGTLTAAETVEVCDGVDVFGMDVAVAAYRVGFEEEGDWLSEYDAILSDAIEELCS